MFAINGRKTEMCFGKTEVLTINQRVFAQFRYPEITIFQFVSRFR